MALTTMTLAELLPLADLRSEQANIDVTGLALDSRHISPGNLFIALAGHSVDGRQYLLQAQNSGAVAALVSADDFDFPAPLTLPIIVVENLAEKLDDIACRFYRQPFSQLDVIGVTGTNGKTSCSQLIAQLLTNNGYCTGVLGTAGWGLGEAQHESTHTTPDAVGLQAIAAQLVDQGATSLAMEVSSHALDQNRVSAIRFNTAVFTNLSRDHLDYHGTMQAYAEAKRKLFQMPSLQHAVVNIDDEQGRQLLGFIAGDVDVIRYSILDEAADLFVSDLSYCLSGVSGVIHYRGQQAPFRSPLLGEFNVANVLATVAVLLLKGVSLSRATNSLHDVKPARGRLQLVPTEHNLSVLVDYAHTPDALEKVLLSLRKHTERRLWVVFGCGGDRDNGKRPLMAEAACLADCVVVTSDNPRTEDPQQIIAQILPGLCDGTERHIIADREQAIAFAVNHAEPGDCIVVAGKGHETYQDIKGVKYPFDDFDKINNALLHRVK